MSVGSSLQRIVSSTPFQKSTRLRELSGGRGADPARQCPRVNRTTHRQRAVHKPSDYSPLEDSSRWVHVRPVTLNFAEYFNEEGRNEPVILEIPKACPRSFGRFGKLTPPRSYGI